MIEPTKQHSSHNQRWQLLDTSSQIPVCLACVIEIVEDSTIVLLKKKPGIVTFLRLLTSNGEGVIESMNHDPRVAAHFTMAFVGLLDVTDDSISNVAVEVVLQLVLQVKSEDLVCYVLDVITQQCLKLCNFSKSVSYFNLAGRMLSSIAPLASQMVESYGSFIDYIYTGLSYPDETIQSSLCFILVHIYSSESLGAIPSSLHARGVEGVMVILGQAQSQELLLNALGLLKKMFAVPGAIHQLVSYSNSGTTLSSVIKKLLLLKKPTLQIAVIQCLCGIVSSDRGQHATGMLLQGDVAEFLFEALPTTNELLLSSLFCCLLLFTESDVFFQKCHAVYGLESILRGIEQAVKLQSHQTTLHGMNLLSNILHKQPNTVRLFSNVSVLKQCLGIICQGLQCISHHVFMTSVEAFHNICKKEYLTTHVPYESLLMLLHHLAMVVSQNPQLSTTSTRFHHESVKLRKKIAEKQNGTSTKSEDRLFGLISSIEKVLEVQIDGGILGSSTELMNNGGKDGTMSQQNFCIEVLQICDEVCIPVTMMNLKLVRNVKIFQGLYNSLLHLQSIMGNNRELYLKLVSCGFIEFSLQVKYLHSCDELHQSVDTFLLKVCLTLLDDGYTQNNSSLTKETPMASELTDLLQNGLPIVKGSFRETLCLLCQQVDHNEANGDQVFSSAQYSLITLLYVAVYYGDSLELMDHLLAALDTFICLHPQLFHLPAIVLQYLLVLYSTCCCSCEAEETSQYHSKARDIVLGCLDDDPTLLGEWCSWHVSLLHWAFQSPVSSQTIGKRMLHIWMCSSCGNNREDLLRLAFVNPLCLLQILELVSESHGKRMDGVEVLSEISNQAVSTGCRSVADTIREWVPDILMKIFLHDTLSRQGLIKLLQMYCSLQSMCPVAEDTIANQIPPSSTSTAPIASSHTTSAPNSANQPITHIIPFKLIYHVIKLLHKEINVLGTKLQEDDELKQNNDRRMNASEAHEDVSENPRPLRGAMDSESGGTVKTRANDCGDLDLVVCCIETINYALVQEHSSKETQVSSILLSNTQLMVSLGNLLQSGRLAVCRCVYELITGLIISAHYAQIQMEPLVNIETNQAVTLVKSSNISEQLTILAFWMAYFNTTTSDMVKFYTHPDARRLSESESECLGIGSLDLRRLVIYLQHCILQGSGRVQHLAVDCYRSLLNYTETRSAHLANHLLNQPWNHLILQATLDKTTYDEEQSINDGGETPNKDKHSSIATKLISMFLASG
ncbi:unnamed protein product [Owenia fusiformis]|uniref:Uncharacterized protein n=1 Tax=Owenia fusiformis TaxID=6347 RepID=A0A8J1UB38_OWEFU|nr:unnamed protein product [Owenia fusiformis]